MVAVGLPDGMRPSARGVLVVCDLTRENTFDAVAKWKAEIDEWARIERREGIPVVLIANKVRSIPAHTCTMGVMMTRAVEGGHLPLPPWLTCVLYAAPCPAAVRPADGPVGLFPGRGQHGAHVPRAQLLFMVRQQPRSECFIQSVSRVVLSAGTMNALVRYLWPGM